MAKEKRIEAELQLPIIQHIQSFLSGRMAARTTLLSKSWYTAWLTRPNLDFDQNNFLGKFNDHEDVSRFWGFMNKTVQRYEDSNLKIESLRLWMYDWFTSYYEQTVAREVIIKAIKMGAIDLCITFQKEDSLFALPHEVFGSENLIRLSVDGCIINLGDGKVRCSGLKSLILDSVYLDGDIIWDIISSCPLVESLSLRSCRVLHKTRFSFADAYTRTRMLSLGPFVGSVVNLYEFPKLKCLLLNGVKIHSSFFDDFSSKFPCLKDLTLYDCDGFKGIRVSGPSLERINFTRRRKMQTLRVKFDVPRIRRFTFSGIHVPSLSFKTATSSNWESDISITCLSNQSDTWFLNLNKLLTKLSHSKVTLKLKISSQSFDQAGKFQGLPKPVVENLCIHDPSSVCPAFFGILLRCCRPVFVAQSVFGEYSFEEISNISFKEAAHKRLMKQASLICSSANQSTCGPCDLGEINWEYFDAAVSAWRPLLSDSSKRPRAEERIRVHLRWGQEPAVRE
ncbi:hypothetical protein ACS0TY_014271 [Phlomoides rotata]